MVWFKADLGPSERDPTSLVPYRGGVVAYSSRARSTDSQGAPPSPQYSVALPVHGLPPQT